MAKTTTRYERGPTPVGLHSKPLPSRPKVCKPSPIIISTKTPTSIELTKKTNPVPPPTRHKTIDLDLELKPEPKTKTKTKSDSKVATNPQISRTPRPRRNARIQNFKRTQHLSPTINPVLSPFNSSLFPDGPLFKTNLTAHNLPHLPIGHSNLFTYLYYPSVYERVALGLPRWHDAVKMVEEWEGRWEELELEMEIDMGL